MQIKLSELKKQEEEFKKKEAELAKKERVSYGHAQTMVLFTGIYIIISFKGLKGCTDWVIEKEIGLNLLKFAWSAKRNGVRVEPVILCG